MKTEFATLLVVTMLAAMLPPNSSAMANNESQSQALRQRASAHVVQQSTPCLQVSLDIGWCQEQFGNARDGFGRLLREHSGSVADLEQALRTRFPEPQTASDLMAKGVPDWLYCVVHPLWCRGL